MTSQTAASMQAAGSAVVPAEPPSRPVGERVKGAWKWLGTTLTELAFKRWDSPVFEPAFWNSTLAGIRILLPLALALLLTCNWLVQRAFGAVPKSLVNKAAVGFAVAGFLTYYDGFNPNVRNGGLYQVNGYYQQFFEAKYHAELGGTWLFDCTLAAEKQLGRSPQLAHRNVRSHVSPEELSVAGSTIGLEDPEQCSSRFSSQRWEAFKADVSAFTKQVDPKVWGKLQAERPMVLSPTWLTVVPWIAPISPDEATFRWSAVWQVVFHAGTLVCVGLGFGRVPAALVSVVWGCQPFMPFQGGVELYQLLWLEAIMCGAAALAKRRFALGIGAVSFGVALQPLALLALLGLVVAFAFAWRSPRQRSFLPVKWGAALIAATALWLALGATSSSYERYTSALEFRASLPVTSDVGVGSLFTNSGSARYRVLRQDSLPDPARPWAKVRSERLNDTRALQTTALVALSLLALTLVWFRQSLWFGVAAGLVPMTLITQPVASCIGFIALAMCTFRRADLWPAVLAATSGAAFLEGHTVFADDRAALLTALLTVTTVVLFLPQWAFLTIRRPRSLQPAVNP